LRGAFCAFDANDEIFLVPAVGILSILGHTLAKSILPMNAYLQSLGDYFAFRQFVEAIGQQLYRENFLVR
jgi:hypothetical protein